MKHKNRSNLTSLLVIMVCILFATCLIYFLYNQPTIKQITRTIFSQIKCNPSGTLKQVTLKGNFLSRCNGKGPFAQPCGLTEGIQISTGDVYYLTNFSEFADIEDIKYGADKISPVIEVSGYVSERKIGGPTNQLAEQKIKEICLTKFDSLSYVDRPYNKIKEDLTKDVIVTTDRREYKVGDYAYVTIKNNFAKDSYKGIGYWGICFLSACTKSEESKISCLPLAGLDCTNSDSRIEPGKQVRLKYPIPLTEAIVSFKFTYVEDPKSYTEETMSNQIVVKLGSN